MNGFFIESVFGKIFKIFNLVIGEIFVVVFEVGCEDIYKVVVVVCMVFDEGFWFCMSIVEWSCFMYKLVDLMEEYKEEFV